LINPTLPTYPKQRSFAPGHTASSACRVTGGRKDAM